MSRFLFRLGRSSALHPWRVLLAWVLVAVGVFALAGAYGGDTQDNWDVDGAPAQVGIDLLRDHVPGTTDGTARVVVHGDAEPDATTLDTLRDRLAGMPHVVAVGEPVFSEDRDTVLIDVGYGVPTTHADLMGNVEPLERAVEPTRDAGWVIELGGDVPETAAAPMKGYGELVGVGAALFILVLVFGSVVGAGLPVVVALAGLAVGAGGLTLLAATMDVSEVAPTVATMVGLGVGIDYALLLVSRHVEFLRAGHGVAEAAGRAAATAGRAVVFASATVLVSLSGLRLTGLPTFDSFCFATAIAVVSVMAAAITLVPALAGFAGHRLLPRRERRGAAARPASTPLTARWAARVARRPLPWAMVAVVLLVTLAAPTLAMRTWPQDASTQSTDLTTRRAHDLVAEEFGAGANGPLLVVARAQQVPPREVARIATDLAGRPDIAAVTPVQTSEDGAVSYFTAQPSFGATDERTGDLVRGVRETLPEGAELTGTTALFLDISEMFTERIVIVIVFVVGMSFLLLAMMFRSLVIPLKAAAMNLLSIGAAYGVLTAVFQWGWGSSLLGLDGPMPVSSWIPILVFAVLFGLSMDYEVFLLSRVREHWLASGDARGSVVRGLADTGRVITCAAAIMVAVFLGFATEVDVVVKQLGLGMATAIFLDATVVRMVLVPATMALLGRWNWWMPGWLERVLPTLDVEGALDHPTDHHTDLDDEAADRLTPAGV